MGLFDMIGNIFSTERTNEMNRRMTQQTNESNIALARERNQMEVDLWREQTAYNSPQAQMQRLQAAGLNPNLVYGQIAESKMASAPDMVAPSVDSPHAEPWRLSDTNPIAEYQQVKNLQALNGLRNAEIKKAKADATAAESNAEYTKYENDAFMNSGATKADNQMLKLWGRGLSGVKDWLLQHSGTDENAHADINIGSGDPKRDPMAATRQFLSDMKVDERR